MNKFLESLENQKFTENGALAFKSTTSKLLDLFSLGGAYRSRSEGEKRALVEDAWNETEDKNYVVKCLFYLRDCRGGVGERDTFRIMAGHIADKLKSEDSIKAFLSYIPEYGRWDDLIWLALNSKSPDVSMLAFGLIKEQYFEDVFSTSGNISLLGKWLPSERVHGKSKSSSFLFMKYFGVSPRIYRTSLMKLRREIQVVEALMSANKWKEIDYQRVPSQAMLRYRNAFMRHDPEGYQGYLNRVTEGNSKINTSTLMPYQITHKVRYETRKGESSSPLQVMWDNLPNWINKKNKNALVVCDVSGSMFTCHIPKTLVYPGDIAVSLALYFSEKCEGDFKDYFITFSESPNLVKVKGDTLYDRINSVCTSDWGFNTNLKAVFDLILRTAKRSGLSDEEIPRTLYVITDMEFDGTCRWNKTLYEHVKEDFEAEGYTLPHIVFWNVDARNNTLPVTKDEMGVTLVSGFSATIFSFAVEGKTPEEFMYSVLDSNRYRDIVVVK